MADQRLPAALPRDAEAPPRPCPTDRAPLPRRAPLAANTELTATGEVTWPDAVAALRAAHPGYLERDEDLEGELFLLYDTLRRSPDPPCDDGFLLLWLKSAWTAVQNRAHRRRRLAWREMPLPGDGRPSTSPLSLPFVSAPLETVGPSPAVEEVVAVRLGLATALAGLSSREREIIAIHLQGYTFKEIADQIGIQEPACRQCYHRAIERLRRALRELYALR